MQRRTFQKWNWWASAKVNSLCIFASHLSQILVYVLCNRISSRREVGAPLPKLVKSVTYPPCLIHNAMKWGQCTKDLIPFKGLDVIIGAKSDQNPRATVKPLIQCIAMQTFLSCSSILRLTKKTFRIESKLFVMSLAGENPAGLHSSHFKLNFDLMQGEPKKMSHSISSLNSVPGVRFFFQRVYAKILFWCTLYLTFSI